jgi:cell wall-associated NlpC family hydrolase
MIASLIGENRPAEWCLPYIDTFIPFKDKGRDRDGFDCWGLVRHVMAEVFGVADLPDYGAAYEAAKDRVSVAKAVAAGLAQGWRQLDQDESPREGDLIILKLAGRPWHCAIAAGGDWMMHVCDGSGVVLEHWTLEPWKNRVEGFYRHV